MGISTMIVAMLAAGVADAGAPRMLSPGVAAQGTIATASPRDEEGRPFGCFALMTKPGEHYDIRMNAQGFAGEVRVARGARCDAAALQRKEGARFTLAAAGGRYLLMARGASANSRGGYSLIATPKIVPVAQAEPDPQPAPIANAEPVVEAAPSTRAGKDRKALMMAQVEQRRAVVEAARQAEEERRRLAEEQRRLAEEQARAEREAQLAAEANRPDNTGMIIGAFMGALNSGLQDMARQQAADRAQQAAFNAQQAQIRARLQAEQAQRQAAAEASRRAVEARQAAQAQAQRDAVANNARILAARQANASGRPAQQSSVQQMPTAAPPARMASANTTVRSVPQTAVRATPQTTGPSGASFVPPVPSTPPPAPVRQAQRPAPPPPKSYPPVPEAVSVCISRGEGRYTCFHSSSSPGHAVGPNAGPGYETPEKWLRWVGNCSTPGPALHLNDGGIAWGCGYGVSGDLVDAAVTSGTQVQGRGTFYCGRDEQYCRRRTPTGTR
ncbi:hypothetical protein [Sphingomonas crocodyli]|uniref:Uncharacterized protein n=1 Tax=Sphingomonas crocodyli TaxID=1979270 RepID=A0A437M7Z2_9SPHN|nr:hypothetical protein [Sphingomonas crocodyli]RVT93830.1 hypothetical protein EOD43_08190 [Sphingomonas crocodyli]